MENIEKRMTILDFINQPFISLRTKNSLIFINEHYTYMDELSVVKLGKFRKVGIQTIFEIQKYYPNLKNELQVISNYEIGKYLKGNRKYKPTNTPTKKMSNIEDKIQAWVNANASDNVKVKELVEIAKEFAKDFALWKEYQVQQDEDDNYYGESRIGVSRKNPVNIHSLMEVYLDEKRLWNKQIDKLK
jgi:DNA-binding transcriptional regulator YhcF (GntR family)